MGSSLSNFVNNVTEGVEYKDYDCFLEYGSVKENLIKNKCLSCDKDYSNKIHEELKDQFKNTFKFFQ